MTSHPPEPAAEWPPSPEGRPAGHGPRPAAPPDEWPAGTYHGHTGEMPAAGPRAPAGYPPNGVPLPLPEYPPPDPPRTTDFRHPDLLSPTDFRPEGYPEYPPIPDYPPRTDYPQDGYPGDDYPPMPDYPPVPDYPAASGSGYPPAPGHTQDGYPATEYPANGYPTAGFPATPAVPPQATPSARSEEAHWGMLAYLAVPFFGFVVPVAVYLLARRRSRWLRAHAAQALNVWLTVVLYDLSAVIMGAMLALDTRQVALAVVVPLVVLLWLVMLTFLLRAAGAASRGRAYTIPRWLCSTMVR